MWNFLCRAGCTASEEIAKSQKTNGGCWRLYVRGACFLVVIVEQALATVLDGGPSKHGHDFENWDTFCHISKQGCHSHHQLQPPWMWVGQLWRNSGRKELLPSSSCQTATTPYGELRGNSGCEKRVLAPDSWGAYQRNDFSEPRLLHLPMHSKALNSLTWVIWFSLINSNVLMFRLPAICCKTSLTYGSTPPSPPPWLSFRVTWDAVSQAWSPQNSHCIK